MLKRLVLIAALLIGMAGLSQAQVLMPGPSGTLLNAVTATTTSSAFSISGYGITTFQVQTAASASGTVAFQGSMDNTNWAPMSCWNTGTSTIATSIVASTSIASGFVTCNTDGIPSVRVVLSPYISGTFTANVGVSAMPRAK